MSLGRPVSAAGVRGKAGQGAGLAAARAARPSAQRRFVPSRRGAPCPARSAPLLSSRPARPCALRRRSGGGGEAGGAALRPGNGRRGASRAGRGAPSAGPGRAGGSAARPEGRLKVGPGRASRGVPLGSLGSARRAFDRGEGCARREAAGRPSGAASGPGLVKSAEVWQHRPGHRVGGRCGSAGRLCPELRAALRPGAAPSGAERASAERSLCGELGAVCGCGTLR